MRRYRHAPNGWDLAPWVALNASPCRRLLPDGYFGTGVQRSDGGTVLRLFRSGAGLLADRVVAAEGVRLAVESLTDLAWIDARERSGMVVTTDADGWIRSIEDA